MDYPIMSERAAGPFVGEDQKVQAAMQPESAPGADSAGAGGMECGVSRQSWPILIEPA